MVSPNNPCSIAARQKAKEYDLLTFFLVSAETRAVLHHMQARHRLVQEHWRLL
jgi:hypothetical protein